jgi:hypothetical protein
MRLCFPTECAAPPFLPFLLFFVLPFFTEVPFDFVFVGFVSFLPLAVEVCGLFLLFPGVTVVVPIVFSVEIVPPGTI